MVDNPLLTNPMLSTTALPFEEEAVSGPTFDYVDNRTRGKAKNLYEGNEVKQLGVDGLREEFNASDNDELRAAFGNFDNYLNYMTERQALIDAGSYNTNWFDVPEAADTASSLRGREDLSRAERLADPTAGYSAQEQAYNEWQQSPENQQLMAKYGLDKPMVNQDGDQYAWNGSSYVKTSKVDDHAGIGDYAKIIGGIGLGMVAGPALAGLVGLTGTTASVVGSALGSAINQGITTGNIDVKEVLKAGAMAGLSSEALTYLKESGKLEELAGAVDSLSGGTGDMIQLPNGSLITLEEAAKQGIDVAQVYQSALPGYDFVTVVNDATNIPDWVMQAAQGTVDVVGGIQDLGKGNGVEGGGTASLPNMAGQGTSSEKTDSTDQNKDEETVVTTEPVAPAETNDPINPSDSNDLNGTTEEAVVIGGSGTDLTNNQQDSGLNDKDEQTVVITDGGSEGSKGLLSGGGAASKFEPKWSELFQYTTLTPYQKKQLAPYKDYVQQAKGMLS